EQMLEQVQKGEVEAILVWKLDRLSRQPGQFEKVIDTCQATGTKILSCNDPSDITSPTGLAFMRIGIALAAMRSETKSLRVKNGLAAEAKNGKPHHGGLRRYGYTRDFKIIPPEAEVIKEASWRVLAGQKIEGIVEDFHSRQIRSSTGRFFTSITLPKLL